MRRGSIWKPVGWKPVGLAVLALALGAPPAAADDQVKIGKWEFHVEVEPPNMPKLPPGVQIGAGGMTVTHSSCVTEANPIPPDSRMPEGGDEGGQCTMTKTERNGGSIS